jgi:hypothetical protein
MKTIDCWQDLVPFGIDPLTGEACALSWRILFDVTESGRKIVARCLGVPNLKLAEAWNRGSVTDPHVGSVMLTQEMLTPLAVFALLESGCSEVWVFRSGGVLGVEPDDDWDRAEASRKYHGESIARVFRQGPDRNRHAMTGRVE